MSLRHLNNTYSILSDNQSAQRIKPHHCNLHTLCSSVRCLCLESTGTSGDDEHEQPAPRSPSEHPRPAKYLHIFHAIRPLATKKGEHPGIP